MQPEVLSEIVAGRIWASERQVKFSGVKLRARTSVIRLEDGALMVLSPTPPSDAWAKQVAELGTVRWLVVPNCFHHLGTPAAAAAYTDAKIVAPKSAAARNPDLRIDVDIHESTFTDAVPEFTAIRLEGVPFLDETLLYHRPTETLFGADVVLRADENDHWTWRFSARIVGCYKRVRVPHDVKKTITDKDAALRSLQALQTLSIKRLVIAHGIVIDEPLPHLLEAWRLVGVG